MKRTKMIAVVAAVLSALIMVALADDRRSDKSLLVIMTFNAEFLWDGVEPEEGQVDFPWKGSQSEAEEHMAKVAEVISRSNPDIVNLVEVESLEALKKLNDQFLPGRGYKPYLVKGTDTYTGQDVCLLTRIDPKDGTITRDARKGTSAGFSKAVSKNYVAKFEVGTDSPSPTKLALVGIHLLARPNDQGRRVEREAQADAVRSIAQELQQSGYEPVVLGDFNDYDGIADSRDHIDSTPVSSVLSMIRQLKANDPSDDLINAASRLPKASRYTAFYDANENSQVDAPSELTSIDHVLLAPDLAAKVEFVEIPHQHDPRIVSDHFPVVVRLRLTPPGPLPPGMAHFRIESLLPNPPGDENQNEEATIKNVNGNAATLSGWKLRDVAGKAWALDSLGTLSAGQSKTIKRSGQAMALNNSGDTVDLVDPAGNVVQTVNYAHADEGEVISFVY